MKKLAFKFRIYPGRSQRTELDKQFGCSRFVYNHYRAVREGYYQDTATGLTYHDTAIDLTEQLKVEYPWLKEADSQTLQQALKDLDRAYQNFFAGRADYPNFKRKFDNGCPRGAIRYPQRFKLEGNTIYLPKVGWVKIVRHRRIDGKMKNATGGPLGAKTKTGNYFVSLQCEIEQDVQPTTNTKSVGIDLGLKDFAILHDGEKKTTIDKPTHLRKAEKALSIRQRRLSRKVKGSNNRTKARVRVASTHEKVANRRKDFHHKESRKIVNAFGSLGLETLKVDGMLKNHNLAKSIADAGWSQFVSFIEYKADWAGVEIVRHSQWEPTSKTCHDCGYINRSLTLIDRTWTCPAPRRQPGVIHDRDENAAKNLRLTTLGARGINALRDTTSAVRRSAQEKFQVSYLEAQVRKPWVAHNEE